MSLSLCIALHFTVFETDTAACLHTWCYPGLVCLKVPLHLKNLFPTRMIVYGRPHSNGWEPVEGECCLLSNCFQESEEDRELLGTPAYMMTLAGDQGHLTSESPCCDVALDNMQQRHLTWKMAQLVKYFPCKCDNLNSIPHSSH